MTDKMRSFLKGLALGLAGKPLEFAKEPVAYLYNGVRLPKLPAWDKEVYPYAVIYYSATYDKTWLRFSKAQFVYGQTTGHSTNYVSTNTDTYLESSIDHSAGEVAWCEVTEANAVNPNDYVTTGINMTLRWANHNVCYDKYSDDGLPGAVALAASEPVPVYE